MVDYSGNVVDTFGMTKGLFDAYSKARSEQMTRDKMAAEMKQSADQADARNALANGFANGTLTRGGAAAGFVRSGNPAQAMDSLKLSPQQWQQLGQPPLAGMQQGTPPQMGGQQNLTPQYEMPANYQAPQGNPVALPMLQGTLEQIRRWNQDRGLPLNSMRGAWNSDGNGRTY